MTTLISLRMMETIALTQNGGLYIAYNHKKQNRVYANIQRDFELNVESMQKLIMIKNNGHEIISLAVYSRIYR